MAEFSEHRSDRAMNDRKALKELPSRSELLVQRRKCNLSKRKYRRERAIDSSRKSLSSVHTTTMGEEFARILKNLRKNAGATIPALDCMCKLSERDGIERFVSSSEEVHTLLSAILADKTFGAEHAVGLMKFTLNSLADFTFSKLEGLVLNLASFVKRVTFFDRRMATMLLKFARNVAMYAPNGWKHKEMLVVLSVAMQTISNVDYFDDNDLHSMAVSLEVMVVRFKGFSGVLVQKLKVLFDRMMKRVGENCPESVVSLLDQVFAREDVLKLGFVLVHNFVLLVVRSISMGTNNRAKGVLVNLLCNLLVPFRSATEFPLAETEIPMDFLLKVARVGKPQFSVTKCLLLFGLEFPKRAFGEDSSRSAAVYVARVLQESSETETLKCCVKYLDLFVEARGPVSARLLYSTCADRLEKLVERPKLDESLRIQVSVLLKRLERTVPDEDFSAPEDGMDLT